MRLARLFLPLFWAWLALVAANEIERHFVLEKALLHRLQRRLRRGVNGAPHPRRSDVDIELRRGALCERSGTGLSWGFGQQRHRQHQRLAALAVGLRRGVPITGAT